MQEETIQARTILPIFFSSVTNTSKKIAYQLENKLENHQFISMVFNIGDYDPDEILDFEGTIIFILSTYGNGNSPPDGEKFEEWLQALKKSQKSQHVFSKLSFVILALGNRSFEHFCGNGRSVRQSLISLGAHELIEITLCNANSTEDTAACIFEKWSNKLIENLEEKYELKDIMPSSIGQKYRIKYTNDPVQKWEEKIKDEGYLKTIGQQFLSFYKMYKAEVIHIKQLRQEVTDGRSTLWIRMKIPEGMKLEPACNISVFPQNIKQPDNEKMKGSLIIEPVKQNSKIPYPSMSVEELWRISNFNQNADINIMKKACRLSSKNSQAKQQFSNYLKNPELLQENPVRCSYIQEKLEPGFEFLVGLGLNTVRPYTLASWKPQEGYFDLVAAITPNGLTSNYYQSLPKHIRVNPIESAFYVPGGRPILMIANGSGIAPFRSLTQHLLANSMDEQTKLYLYFGIQNKDRDYYFKDEWQNYQKQGKITIKIAQSRVNPQKKFYVQDLLKNDHQFIKEHIFNRKGVIFICGSSGMARSVDTEIFEAIKLHEHIPFKAFKLSKELIKNKTIVKQVFQ